MRKQTLKQRTATAWHEAGHAVAYFHFDRRFRYVTIKPKEDNLGHLQPGKPPKWLETEQDSARARIWLETSIVCFFAGTLAEALYTGRCSHIGGHGDYGQLADAALAVCGSDQETTAFLRWLRIRTANFVKHPIWRACIEAVANALLERETLTQQEVFDVIRHTLDSVNLSASSPASPDEA